MASPTFHILTTKMGLYQAPLNLRYIIYLMKNVQVLSVHTICCVCVCMHVSTAFLDLFKKLIYLKQAWKQG